MTTFHHIFMHLSSTRTYLAKIYAFSSGKLKPLDGRKLLKVTDIIKVVTMTVFFL